MFKKGDIIVAIRTHGQGWFKKGDVFEIKLIHTSPCTCHKFLVHIGLFNPKPKNIQRCTGCKKKYLIKNDKVWFSNYYFVKAQYGQADLLEKQLAKEEEVLNENALTPSVHS
jgi:hypothetical protein